MSPSLPVVSGREVIAALERGGYQKVRQRGSHVRLRHADAAKHKPVTVPMHKEIRAGLLRAILRDASLTVDAFGRLLQE